MAGSFVSSMLSGCTIALTTVIACGQSFPTKPVRLITAEAGGGADFIARLLAQVLSADLGYQVLVDNQGGASGIIAAQSVIKARADGHPLLFSSTNTW